MNASIFIARVMGPVMLVMGAGLLLNADGYRAMARDFLKSPALIFLAGFVTLLLGLLIVAAHNRWVADWPVLITVLGWVMVAAGVARMNFPGRLKKTGEKMIRNAGLMNAAAVLYLAAGALLTWFGWLA